MDDRSVGLDDDRDALLTRLGKGIGVLVEVLLGQVVDSVIGAFGATLLRHYYASALIRCGQSPKVVQRRLGHASAAETLEAYSHLWPDSDNRTRQARTAGQNWLSRVDAGQASG